MLVVGHLGWGPIPIVVIVVARDRGHFRILRIRRRIRPGRHHVPTVIIGTPPHRRARLECGLRRAGCRRYGRGQLPALVMRTSTHPLAECRWVLQACPNELQVILQGRESLYRRAVILAVSRQTGQFFKIYGNPGLNLQ